MIALVCDRCFADLHRTSILDEWECAGCHTHYLIKDSNKVTPKCIDLPVSKEGWWIYKHPIPPHNFELGYGPLIIILDGWRVYDFQIAHFNRESSFASTMQRFTQYVINQAKQIKPDFNEDDFYIICQLFKL